MRYFLAIDLGASSGRHILGWHDGGKLHTEIIHNFRNDIIDINGVMCWDIDRLFAEIVRGVKKCADIGKIPETVSIDGFGVDFVLLDVDGERMGNAVSYRDGRTEGMEGVAFQTISSAELFQKTGIASHIFNTIYQLMAMKKLDSDTLERADSLLLLPDYFNYLLTGNMMTEYTNASTTGLLNGKTRNWDDSIINTFALPRRIFGEIYNPGEFVGEFSAEIADEVGFTAKVVLCASHDTASAVTAVPFDIVHRANSLYLNSGTWSLLGAELDLPIVTEDARNSGFSNEGGYNNSIRFLKNIMGMWLIQSVKKELGDKIGFAELNELARISKIESVIDCEDVRFFAPASMMGEIADFCAESGQQIPQSAGEFARVIYKSLATCYAKSISEIEVLLGKSISHLHIIGGGSQADFLNELTAETTGKQIISGPIEATAIGNLAVQMIVAGIFRDLDDARNCIRI